MKIIFLAHELHTLVKTHAYSRDHRKLSTLCFDMSSDILAFIFAAKYEKPAGQDPGFYTYHNDYSYGGCNVGIVVYTEG